MVVLKVPVEIWPLGTPGKREWASWRVGRLRPNYNYSCKETEILQHGSFS